MERTARRHEAVTLDYAQIELAEIVIGLRRSCAEEPRFRIPPEHVPFLGDQEPDLVLTCQSGPIPPQLLVGELVFDEGWMWSLHQNEYGLVWRQMSVSAGDDPQRAAVMDVDFSAGRVYTAPSNLSSSYAAYPLQHPLDKFVYDHLLVRRHGVTCHACGISDHGRGMLFVGESGAGKSTMAELWDKVPGVAVLSDERTVLRRRDQGFHIYGTPWHGTAGLFSPTAAPLASILFLSQGTKNSVSEIHLTEAVRRLIVCSYLPFWSSEGMENALQLFHEVGLGVPCYELTFVPDGSVVGFLRGLW